MTGQVESPAGISITQCIVKLMDKIQSDASAFVILLHQTPTDTDADAWSGHSLADSTELRGSLADRGSHWDLMFKVNQKLETWAVERLPRALFSTAQMDSMDAVIRQRLVDESPILDQPQSAIRLPSHRLEYLYYEGTIGGDRGTVDRFFEGSYRLLPPVANFDATQLRLEIMFRGVDQQKWLFEFQQIDRSNPIHWQLTMKPMK